jgi:hypothetical protein
MRTPEMRYQEIMKNRFARGIALLVLASCLSAVTNGWASDEDAGQPSLLYIPPRLQRSLLIGATMKLLNPPAGQIFDVIRTNDHQMFMDGCEFDRYEVTTTKSGTRVGEFVRLRAYSGEKSSMDLAMTLDGPKITAVYPMRAFKVDGVEVPEVPPALVGLNIEEVATAGGERLATVFRALSRLEDALGSKAPPAPDEAKARAMVALLHKLKPLMAPGTPMPKFDAPDEKGKAFSSTSLAGRPAVVLMCAVDQELSRDVMAWTSAYLKDHPDKFQLVEIMQGDAEAVERYRKLGGTTAATVIPDVSLTIYERFKTLLGPSAFLFDSSGKLVEVVEPPFSTPDALWEKLGKLGR